MLPLGGSTVRPSVLVSAVAGIAVTTAAYCGVMSLLVVRAHPSLLHFASDDDGVLETSSAHFNINELSSGTYAAAEDQEQEQEPPPAVVRDMAPSMTPFTAATATARAF